jgi:hypothetical protein
MGSSSRSVASPSGSSMLLRSNYLHGYSRRAFAIFTEMIVAQWRERISGGAQRAPGWPGHDPKIPSWSEARVMQRMGWSGSYAVLPTPSHNLPSGHPIQTIIIHLSTPPGGVIQTERVMNFPRCQPMIKLASEGVPRSRW